MRNIFQMISGAFDMDADREMKNLVADMLKTEPEKLEAFEKAYRGTVLNNSEAPDNVFEMNAKQAAGKGTSMDEGDAALSTIIERIVRELVAETPVITVENGSVTQEMPATLPDGTQMVTCDELAQFSETVAPQLSGRYMRVQLSRDILPYEMILSIYARFLREKDHRKRKEVYGLFRAGLDIQDLDPVMYAMLGMNRNSMSHWLPSIAKAAYAHGFFKIPKTKIARVPLPLLQMSRLDYEGLTPATLKIVDDWAFQVLGLDITKTYFIKTGTYSSKYDFRNARVTSEKEVRELGEYLLFIQNQACMMAGPLTMPHPIYGVSTTNEWVVREFIDDTEGNPTIYKGLPLHTEYRIFVDFDADEVIGYTPYWEPDTMKRRFSSMDDAASPHLRHDYVIFKMHEETLMGRYQANIETVLRHIVEMLPDVELDGQWSIDIMQNGDDFYLIDMALADLSALNECVPKGILKKHRENWIPDMGLLYVEEEESGKQQSFLRKVSP